MSDVEINERFSVPVARDRLWELMTDPDTVVSCIPGAEITGRNEDGSLQGAMRVKLGPTTVRFRGTVVPEFDAANHEGSLQARGSDAKGRTRVNATTSFKLAEASGGDGEQTDVEVATAIDVSGALAPFVSGGGPALAKRMLDEFAVNVTALGNSAAAGTENEPPQARETTPISGGQVIGATVAGMARSALGWVSGRGDRAKDAESSSHGEEAPDDRSDS